VARSQEHSAGSGDPVQSADDLAKMHELEKEHVELESELDLVRARAAELQELVQQLKRELTEQRSGMTDELRELRKMLGQQGDGGYRDTYSEPAANLRESGRHEGRMATATISLSAREASHEPSRDPVRQSTPVSVMADPASQAVMAQFAKLQKDVAQRRKKK
jgi:chromosome segregation ATPase